MTPLKHIVFGKPRDPTDPKVFHTISLVAFLAWVGLGADGLSSSSYGPDEAFRAIQGHEYLALYLALLTTITVGLISFAYSLLLEHFPSGGGGYVVATKLLGPKAGVVSGSALVVDYVLTVTVSVASGVDAIFSFLSPAWQAYKVPTDLAVLLVLLVLNLRGVKESIKILLPIFLVFLATHLLLILYGVFSRLGSFPEVLSNAHTQMASDVSTMSWHGAANLGWVALLLIFLRAYSLGGGTYTGIEAVSNGVQILREPRVATAKRTMLYMALSLAFTAGGILLCYLLWSASPVEGKTMNAVLLERVFSSWTVGHFPVGAWLVVLTLVSEGALLFVAAQTGFIDGPRVLANMAIDSWLPHRFANLSERLVTKHGILLMGIAAGALMIYTKGQVSFLVVLYSINVFLTFSLTQLGMSRFWLGEGRHRSSHWWRFLMVHGAGLLLCVTILVITTLEKFKEGGWLTLVITTSLIAICFAIKSHYRGVQYQIREADEILTTIPPGLGPAGHSKLDPGAPVAALLVSGYGGLGIHSILSVQRLFPGYYKNIMFISLGIVDSGRFKGKDEIQALERETEYSLQRYVAFANSLGLNADYRYHLGTDVLESGQELCGQIQREYPRAVFFLGKLIFSKEKLFYRILHNDTAYSLQRQLQFAGMQTVVLPIRITMG
jgi:amino acid transporter